MIQYSLNLKSEVTVGAIVEFVLTDFNFINQNLNLGLVVKLILIPKFIDHFIHKNIKKYFFNIWEIILNGVKNKKCLWFLNIHQNKKIKKWYIYIPSPTSLHNIVTEWGLMCTFWTFIIKFHYHASTDNWLQGSVLVKHSWQSINIKIYLNFPKKLWFHKRLEQMSIMKNEKLKN